MKLTMATSETLHELGSHRVMLRLVPPADPPVAPRRVAVADDEAWHEALANGDERALTRLYREHHEAVRALVRRMLSTSSDVEDLVHDVFLAAPSAFRRYRGEGSVRSFVFSIAVHHVRHHVRATTRRRSWLDRFRLSPVHSPPPATPEDHNERRELAARLCRAMDGLSFDHRVAVVLCEVEEMTAVEAAGVIGVPEATIRTRLFHAKKKLRVLLEKEDARG
jgi:RNA polymerase sigma-70 factor, ECF subfamily